MQHIALSEAPVRSHRMLNTAPLRASLLSRTMLHLDTAVFTPTPGIRKENVTNERQG